MGVSDTSRSAPSDLVFGSWGHVIDFSTTVSITQNNEPVERSMHCVAVLIAA